MRTYLAVCVAALVMAGCSGTPTTNAALAGQAQQAADRELGQQATFSEMETVVAKQISCGHAKASTGERDFVYQRGRLIMDDSPDFDQAAVDCDTAASGDNASVDVNS